MPPKPIAPDSSRRWLRTINSRPASAPWPGRSRATRQSRCSSPSTWYGSRRAPRPMSDSPTKTTSSPTALPPKTARKASQPSGRNGSPPSRANDKHGEGRVMEVAPGIHRIEAPLGDRINCLYVLAGEDDSMLVDTGLDNTPHDSLLPYL